MHAFAGDSSFGGVPTEASNAGTVLSNPNASELCLICKYKSHSPTPELHNIVVFLEQV